MKKIIRLTESDLARIVRRVISEVESPATTPAKTVKINGVDISTYDESTKKNKTYEKMLSQAYTKLGNETISQISKEDALNDGEFVIFVSDAKLNDYENSVKDPRGWGYYVDCEKLDTLTELPGGSSRGWGKLKSKSGLKTMNHNFTLDDTSKLMLKRKCIAYFPKYELPYKNTTPLYDN
jgi:hypothetical protein